MSLRIRDERAYGGGHGQGHRQGRGAIAVKRFGGEVARDLIKFKTERDAAMATSLERRFVSRSRQIEIKLCERGRINEWRQFETCIHQRRL